MSAFDDAPMPAEYRRRLDEIVSDCANKLGIKDREGLRDLIQRCDDDYHSRGLRYVRRELRNKLRRSFFTAAGEPGAVPIDRAEDSLDQLADAIGPVLDLLSDDLNVVRLEQGATAEEEIPDTLRLRRDLTKLREVARARHRGGADGRPSKSKDAPDLVRLMPMLHEGYAKLTGKPFTRDFAPGGDPITEAMVFVVKVIEFIDPRRVNELSRITRDYIAELP